MTKNYVIFQAGYRVRQPWARRTGAWCDESRWSRLRKTAERRGRERGWSRKTCRVQCETIRQLGWLQAFRKFDNPHSVLAFLRQKKWRHLCTVLYRGGRTSNSSFCNIIEFNAPWLDWIALGCKECSGLIENKSKTLITSSIILEILFFIKMVQKG